MYAVLHSILFEYWYSPLFCKEQSTIYIQALGVGVPPGVGHSALYNSNFLPGKRVCLPVSSYSHSSLPCDYVFSKGAGREVDSLLG
jgi:hypothetical protein